jgi:hypothetical protein
VVASHAIGFAESRHDTRSPGFGACGNDGEDCEPEPSDGPPLKDQTGSSPVGPAARSREPMAKDLADRSSPTTAVASLPVQALLHAIHFH